MRAEFASGGCLEQLQVKDAPKRDLDLVQEETVLFLGFELLLDELDGCLPGKGQLGLGLLEKLV